MIVYCVSGACGGALVILALLIGIYIGKAKKSFDKHLKLRQEGMKNIWSTLKKPPMNFDLDNES